MKVYKIVLTGGPCGGKTKIFERLTEYLTNMKYKVILVPETARDVISAGIKPNPNDKNYTLWFQDFIMKYQNLKEKFSEIYVEEHNNQDVVILYDRAIPDNFAYLENYKDYENTLKKNGLKELKTIDNYDLIINLSSIVNFENFEYETDSERSEDNKLAKKLDFKTSTAYLLSRNIKIVYPTDNIDDKFEIVKNYINQLLCNNEVKEIIKYNVDTNKTNFNVYNNNNSRTLFITDTYLANDLNNIEYVLSRRQYNDEVSFVLSKTIEKDNSVITYANKIISEDEYNNLIRKYRIIRSINKKEIVFIYDFKRYKLVIDEDYNCTLEVEKSNFLSEIKIPSNIKLQNNLVKAKKYDSI